MPLDVFIEQLPTDVSEINVTMPMFIQLGQSSGLPCYIFIIFQASYIRDLFCSHYFVTPAKFLHATQRSLYILAPPTSDPAGYEKNISAC